MDNQSYFRKQLLDSYYEAACSRLFSYSANYLMTKPKEGYEKEWDWARREVKEIGNWRKEYEQVEVYEKNNKIHIERCSSPGNTLNIMIQAEWTHLGTMSVKEAEERYPQLIHNARKNNLQPCR